MKTRRNDPSDDHSDDHSDGPDDGPAQNGGISEYERMRLENIRKNQEAMRNFGITEAIAVVAESAAKKKRGRPPLTPGIQREKRVKNTEVLPRRQSNRLANIAPDDPVAKNKHENMAKSFQALEFEKRARRTGDLSLADVNEHGDDAKFSKLMQEMATYVPEKARMKDPEDENTDDETEVKQEVKDEKIKEEEKEDKAVKEEKDDSKVGIRKYFSPRTTRGASTASKDVKKESQPVKAPASSSSSKEPSLRKKVQNLRIKGPWPTAKVCQGRIYCMAVHENKDKILVCGGDIDGNLGFWDLNEDLADDYEPEYDEEPNIYSYKAHSRTLSSMQYSPTDPTKLFTSSYDGSIRYLDLVKQQFIESYVVSADASDHLGSISIDSTGQQLWFADVEGAVTLKDIRTPKNEIVYRKTLHDKKVGCVNVNPKYGNLIVTSSLDRTMRIWDIRTFGKSTKVDEPLEELAAFPHNLSVTSAMWSPDGASIASTSYDDYVRVFNNFDPALPNIKEIPEPIKIRHNNQSGRWVTMLRAVWSHQFNWFCIGNMNKSLDIYSRGTGDLMANLKDARVLTTVPAVNAWHPNRVVLGSGMANGKMVIWR
ncbi:hypothetical protein EMPS_04475 [Entomortierella parvispora]|uniref:DNA damage-binding protein CMR1 n=1 Tax=Entomortierella parvispora TaxID=205924 RepID=A0A9P3H951_9FUNG|nr:hypothetical protein EMPS_04475 [Entomortierella parvispora]